MATRRNVRAAFIQSKPLCIGCDAISRCSPNALVHSAPYRGAMRTVNFVVVESVPTDSSMRVCIENGDGDGLGMVWPGSTSYIKQSSGRTMRTAPVRKYSNYGNKMSKLLIRKWYSSPMWRYAAWDERTALHFLRVNVNRVLKFALRHVATHAIGEPTHGRTNDDSSR